MLKRVILLVIIVILVVLICNYSIQNKYKELSWTYKFPDIETPEYVTFNKNSVLLTTETVKNSFLHIINKKDSTINSSIKFDRVVEAPKIVGNYIIVVTQDSHDSEYKYINVIELLTSNLVWKDRFYSNYWSYITDGKNIIYVDSEGNLRKYELKSKFLLWKILIGGGFKDSSKPSLQDDKLFMCNDNILWTINNESSKILSNYEVDHKTKFCAFDDYLAVVLMNNDMIYTIDLSQKKIIWRYRFVSLFSESFFKILNHKYLAILNTVKLSELTKTARARLPKKIHQTLYVLAIYTGTSKWQKDIKYPLNIANLAKSSGGNVIVIQTVKGKLVAYDLERGLKLWNFYSKEGVTPEMKYTIYNSKVFLTLKNNNGSFLYIINLADGKLIQKLKIPVITKKALSPIVDTDKVYIITGKNILSAFNISKDASKK